MSLIPKFYIPDAVFLSKSFHTYPKTVSGYTELLLNISEEDPAHPANGLKVANGVFFERFRGMFIVN